MVATTIRMDVSRLYGVWMELFYPHQLESHPVFGKWRPENPIEWIPYLIWSVIGLVFTPVTYPIIIFGMFVRLVSRRIGQIATRLGIQWTSIGLMVLWGALSVVTYTLVPLTEAAAVVAAGIVAVASSFISFKVNKNGGKVAQVLISYPATFNSLFLPPIVAALVAPTIGELVLPMSYSFAVFVTNQILPPGIEAWIQEAFELEGVMHAVLWFVLSTLIGWVLGFLVHAADVIRPTDEDN